MVALLRFQSCNEAAWRAEPWRPADGEPGGAGWGWAAGIDPAVEEMESADRCLDNDEAQINQRGGSKVSADKAIQKDTYGNKPKRALSSGPSVAPRAFC